MTKKMINLTLSIVIEKIETILTTYPRFPYQQAFSDQGLRYDLVAYVLNRVPNKFAVLEEEALSKSTLLLACPSPELLDIEFFIRLGICELLQTHKRVNFDIEQPYNQTFTHLSSKH